MYSLGDFATTRNNLPTAKRAVVVALHKLVFENEVFAFKYFIVKTQ